MDPSATRLLVVTAVERERAAIGEHRDVVVLAGGIGRTNAASATTEALLRRGPFVGVISAGIAGALPAVTLPAVTLPAVTLPAGTPGVLPSGARAMLPLGAVVVASACAYVEEGLAAPEGFQDMRALGGGRLSLGDFEGNVVPVDDTMARRVAEGLGRRLDGPIVLAPIATVATCSGSDAAALEVVRRTTAMMGRPAAAEAMEGAAVVHAARRLGVPAIEIRTISNTTGDRGTQRWDLEVALGALGRTMQAALGALRDGASTA